MAELNKKIMENGVIVEAVKLPVITIGIGPVAQLKDLEGIIWHDGDNVVIKTKEAPDGCTYDQSLTAVVRIIGDKVLMNGLYDIYAPAASKIAKLLSNPIDMSTIPSTQLAELQPILNVASEVRPSLAPADEGRKVIEITESMCGADGHIDCVCSWEEASEKTTTLYPGDFFLVEDEEKAMGYRIGKDEFEETHALV